jgi:hypothetical protein
VLRMRKWFCHVLESFHENVEKDSNLIYDYPSQNCSVDAIHNLSICNKEGKVTVWALTRGMGFADFEDQDDYDTRLSKVIKKKIERIKKGDGD